MAERISNGGLSGTKMWTDMWIYGPRQRQQATANPTLYQEIANVSSRLVIDGGAKRVGVYQSHGGENRQWFLDPVPSPGPGWVLLRNGETGRFFSSEVPGNVGQRRAGDGVGRVCPVEVFQKGRPRIYILVNRATGDFLR